MRIQVQSDEALIQVRLRCDAALIQECKQHPEDRRARNRFCPGANKGNLPCRHLPSLLLDFFTLQLSDNKCLMFQVTALWYFITAATGHQPKGQQERVNKSQGFYYPFRQVTKKMRAIHLKAPVVWWKSCALYIVLQKWVQNHLLYILVTCPSVSYLTSGPWYLQ